MNSIYIKLNNELSCEKICNKVQSLLNSHSNSGRDSNDAILVIQINYIDQTSDDLILKITNENIQ